MNKNVESKHQAGTKRKRLVRNASFQPQFGTTQLCRANRAQKDRLAGMLQRKSAKSASSQHQFGMLQSFLASLARLKVQFGIPQQRCARLVPNNTLPSTQLLWSALRKLAQKGKSGILKRSNAQTWLKSASNTNLTTLLKRLVKQNARSLRSITQRGKDAGTKTVHKKSLYGMMKSRNANLAICQSRFGITLSKNVILVLLKNLSGMMKTVLAMSASFQPQSGTARVLHAKSVQRKVQAGTKRKRLVRNASFQHQFGMTQLCRVNRAQKKLQAGMRQIKSVKSASSQHQFGMLRRFLVSLARLKVQFGIPQQRCVRLVPNNTLPSTQLLWSVLRKLVLKGKSGIF